MADLDQQLLRPPQSQNSPFFGEAYEGMPIRPLTASGLAAELLHGNAADADHAFFARPLGLNNTIPDFWQFQQQFQPTVAPFRNYESTWDIAGGNGSASSFERQIDEFFNRNQYLFRAQPLAPQVNYGWPGSALLEPTQRTPVNPIVTPPVEIRPPVEVRPQPQILPVRTSQYPGVSDAEAARFDQVTSANRFSPPALQRALAMDGQERACFNEINLIRSQNNLPPLDFSPTVKLGTDIMAQQAAATQPYMPPNRNPNLNNRNHQLNNNRFNPGRLERDILHGAENAVIGQQNGTSVADRWVTDPAHRNSILNPNATIGAVSRTIDNRGVPHWTFKSSTGDDIVIPNANLNPNPNPYPPPYRPNPPYVPPHNNNHNGRRHY